MLHVRGGVEEEIRPWHLASTAPEHPKRKYGARHAQNRVATVPKRDKPSSGPPVIPSDKLESSIDPGPGDAEHQAHRHCQWVIHPNVPRDTRWRWNRQRVPAWVEEMRRKTGGWEWTIKVEVRENQRPKINAEPRWESRRLPLTVWAYGAINPCRCRRTAQTVGENGRNGMDAHAKKNPFDPSFPRHQDTPRDAGLAKRNYNGRQYVPKPTRLSPKKNMYM